MGGAALYSGYTVVLTRLRTAQRREQNGATKDAQELVVESLLCFETVKLFACEQAQPQPPAPAPA
jgi:ABC-type transport system involved in Fe-S cluster assembly fused permease/ATPase subunit